MSWIANDGLVEITNLDLDMAFRISNWTKISCMAVTANPDRRTLWPCQTPSCLKPLVEFEGVATHISMCRASHLQIAVFGEDSLSVLLANMFLLGQRCPSLSSCGLVLTS